MFETGATSSEDAAARLARLVRDNPAQTKNAASLVALTHAQVVQARQLVQTLAHGNRRAEYTAQINKAFRKPNAQSAGDQFYVALYRLESAEQTLKRERRASTTRLWQSFDVVLLLSAIGGIIVSLGINLLYGRRIVTRLRRLSQDAHHFARSEELLPVLEGDDEIADVSAAFHAMVREVRDREEVIARYHLLSERIRDIILFIDPNSGRILDANKAALAMYGYSREELLQMTVMQLRPPELAPQARAMLAETLERDVLYETVQRRKDGTEFPVQAAGQRAVLGGQEMVVAVLRDISEQRAAEEATQRALAQAMEASRLKSDFVATMSHEIRTPINGVLGMLELLLQTPLDAEQTEFASTAKESGHALLSVINDILDFSKIEAGKVELEVTDFSIVGQIESIGSMLMPQASAKAISLMTFVDPFIPRRLVGDAMRLRQVLVNLTGNAVKFTSEGGVVLSADLAAIDSSRAAVRFSVHDSGIGIDPAAVPALFDPFRQADGSTTRRYGGTGLGLSICKQLVELMGGTIEVDSEPGKGSTFSFRLELPISAEAQRVDERHALDGIRALVVDDDPLACEILARYIRSWEMDAATARSSAQAIEMLEHAAHGANPFDLAVIDLRMPDRDGMELAREIRAHPALRDLRLLLVTAFDQRGQGAAAIEAGFSAYITKPVRQSHLYDGIADAMFGNAPIEMHFQSESSLDMEPSVSARVLLAEDNAINRQLALRQLEKLGIAPRMVQNGREALDAVRAEDFDLILMDCQMPEMDGFEATRAIRKRESSTGKHTPIIAMTANALSHNRDECLAAGMDDYITKPVALAELRSALQRWSRVLPAYNPQRLHDLLAGDSAAIAEMLELAQTQIPALLRRLRDTNGDGKQRLRVVHEIKGAAANVGADKLSHFAATLEGELKAGTEVDMHASLAVLEGACGDFLTESRAARDGAQCR